MPKYTFENTETGEITEVSMRISEREKFIQDNPQLKQVFLSAPNITADPLSNNKHRRGFQEVLNKIHQRSPGSTLNKTAEI
jgi:hypothetical protein